MAAIASYVSGVSSLSAVSTALETPTRTALIDVSGSAPPTTSMRSRSDVLMGTSATPGCCTAPVTVQTIVPGDFSVPTDRNQAAPRAMIAGTLAIVSTLFTSTGGATLVSVSPAIRTSAASPLPLSASASDATTSSMPLRNGGAMRGKGGRP